MDIMGKAKKLEWKIARSLDAAVVELVGKSEPAPLEIVQGVLDRAEQQIQEAGRGHRVFPFNRVRVHVLAPAADKARRARFAAVAEGPPSIASRLQSRLESAGCRGSAVVVEVVYSAKRGAQWDSPEFHVEFARTTGPAPAAPKVSTPPRLKLTVVAGKAAQRAYAFSGGRIDIGRRTEVLDSKQRVVRTNHVAFDEEGPDANRSVSRRHAHIVYDPAGGDYRLQDDRSVHGTNVHRAGRTISVPAGSRGVRLQSGDEILLGQARIRVVMETT
jgi:pSer/pThr/pTyr-binding forkhead associated (FHA) protein